MNHLAAELLAGGHLGRAAIDVRINLLRRETVGPRDLANRRPVGDRRHVVVCRHNPL